MRQIEDFFKTGKNKIQCKERLRSALEHRDELWTVEESDPVLGDWMDVGAGELTPGQVCRWVWAGSYKCL